MKLFKCLTGVLVALTLCAGLAAQGMMGDQVAMHFQITPKAGMHQQFETALKAHANWRKEQGDPWQWYVMQVVTGADHGDYIIRSAEMAWADLDNYEFRDKGTAHFNTTVGPFIESVNSSITAANRAVSNWPEDLIPRLVMVEAFHLKPGKARQFWETVAKAHSAFEGRMGPYEWATTMIGQGAGGGSAVLVLPKQNWAEMKPRNMEMMGYLQEAYGEEGTMELMSQFDECITGVESMVVAVRPDLSIFQMP
ncbi:MAG TPA: hypothetical protein VLU25_18065 [Acidobacteriota bacterium]|nr:hypothetical protein [Acidobacteriota bacterium]